MIKTKKSTLGNNLPNLIDNNFIKFLYIAQSHILSINGRSRIKTQVCQTPKESHRVINNI